MKIIPARKLNQYGSLGVTIPKEVVNNLQITEETVFMFENDNGILKYSPVKEIKC